VQPILRNIRRVLSPRHAFDPTTSRRIFRLSAPDFALSLFTQLLASLRHGAPGVSLEWTGLRNSLLADLAEGQIDVAIAPTPLRLTEDVTGEGIGALRWGCFARKDSPTSARPARLQILNIRDALSIQNA
jgi:DNA-binding transcriptional LysR family regulator